jgi:hypothetical protein
MKLRIKRDLSWFPAGQAWNNAVMELSDGAFKVFAYACLNADRSTGLLKFRQTELARILGKSRRSVATYLQELQRQEYCQVRFGSNQYGPGVIEVDSRVWPYEADASEIIPEDNKRAEYVMDIEKLLQSRACVSCRFSDLDRKLAEEWYEQGVALNLVERAVVTGCGRKYVSWLNGSDLPPIRSLNYFRDILQEICATKAPEEYYEYSKYQVGRLEQKWLSKAAESRS